VFCLILYLICLSAPEHTLQVLALLRRSGLSSSPMQLALLVLSVLTVFDSAGLGVGGGCSMLCQYGHRKHVHVYLCILDILILGP